ncbi:MAG: nitroreductase family protein [Bacteroidota bacterium]
MNFLELAKSRQSCRAYDSVRKVEKEKIDLCLEAARLSPSACNSQPWTFVVVDKEPLREQVAKLTYNTVLSFNKFAVQAPVMVAIIAEKPNTLSQIGGRVKDKDFYLMDIGIAAEHFCLQAAELGLGTCMLGWFSEKELQKMLSLPRNKRVALLITLGYPAADDKLREKKRKSKNEMSKYNSY